MSTQLQEIQATLLSKSSKKDAAFFQKMVPGKQKVYGVKTPVLNAIANNYKKYSFELAEELWKSAALEERIISIKILEKTGKADPKRLLKLFKRFSKQIDNWAIADGLGMQFLRGIVKTHKNEIFAISVQLSHSKDPWQRRLSLVMLEWYTRQPETHAEILRLVKSLEKDDEYYVKKAIAWIRRNLVKGK